MLQTETDWIGRVKAACEFSCRQANDARIIALLGQHIKLCGGPEIQAKRLPDWASVASAARAAWAARAASAARAAWDATWVSCIVPGAAEIGDETEHAKWLPILEALESGLWLYWITAKEISWIPAPEIHHENGRPHRLDGPAFVSLDLSTHFIRGVLVPPHVVENPQSITVQEVESEQNAEVRRVMIERYGQQRYLLDSDAKVIHRDDWGTLYRKEIPGDEPLVMVKVVNSTPEPDGSMKDYFLRVDPRCETARQAVAWTFGKESEEYAPAKET